MIYDRFLYQTIERTEEIWIRRPLQEQYKGYPLMVQYAGNSRCYPGWSNYRKKSNIFAIEYVCRGTALLHQDGREFVINKGEVFILKKDSEHFYSTGPSGLLLKRFITIDGMELENLLRFLNLWGKEVIILKEPKKFDKLLKEFSQKLSAPPIPNMDLIFSTMIYNVLLVLAQSIESSTPPIIEKAVEYIHQNLHRNLSRKEISLHLGISIPHFNRIFTSHFNCSPIKYFINQKLNWTAQLLLKSNLSIKEIAYMAGYDDPLYFSAQFKKLYTKSPRQYRLTHERFSDFQ